jgi:hypothetical protein
VRSSTATGIHDPFVVHGGGIEHDTEMVMNGIHGENEIAVL